MEQNLVTIIVPVYNVEKYVEKCIRSILQQTYQNLEVIIIDDGSTDNSIDIATRVSRKDKRVTIIRKKNEGVSKARNLGISKAHGKYIMFVDSDDFLEKNCVSFFHNIASSSDADIILNYSWHNNFDHNKIIDSTPKKISPELAIEQLYTGKIDVAVWNKFYKLEFLKKNSIEFDPTLWYGEGMLFNITCFSKTNNIMVGDKKVYHQTYNPNSAMRKFSLESNLCGIKSMYRQKEILKPIMTKRINASWKFHLRAYNMSILKGIIRTNTKDDYAEQYKKCIHGLRSGLWTVIVAPISKKTKILFCLAAIAPVRTAKKLIARESSRASV